MMNLPAFFNTWPGMYLAQSFLHSLTAALLVDTALLAWKLEDPLVRQRFRLIAIAAPIVSFPAYQLITPERGGAAFRIDALFDMNRWMNLEIGGIVPVGLLFLLFLGFATAIFALQEMLPIARHTMTVNDESLDARRPDGDSPVARALAGLPGPRPDVFIIETEDFVMFSSTGASPAAYLSSGLVQALTVDEIRAALAHEISHIRRGKWPLMALAFLLRMIMFFNPVVLIEFRRIAQEEEKICDDAAARLAGSRAALARALRKFYFDEDEHPHAMKDAPRLSNRIEEYSHGMLIESRITRLEGPVTAPTFGSAAAFAVTLASVAGINYYIV